MTSIRLFIAALLAAAIGYGAPNRTDAWHEDLKLMLDTLTAKGMTIDRKRGPSSRGQKDFEKLYPHLRQDLALLEADVPHLSDTEIALRLMRLIAAAHVAHNAVNMPPYDDFNQRVPVTFQWFGTDLAVVGATAEFSSALGARVLKIGSKTPHEALSLIAPYIGHENEHWLREMSRDFLRRRAFLRVIGAADDQGPVAFTLQKPGGQPFIISTPTATASGGIVPVTEPVNTPAPLSRSQPGKPYWHAWLPDSGTLFIQYNACRNDPASPFPEFARKVLAEADQHAVKRVVIDLRANGGGDSRIIRPLENGLKSRARKLGPVYVMIGRKTFSSAADNAAELRRTLGAKLVGEPSGGMFSSYGELKFIKLPNSGLTIQYTSKWFGSHKATEPDALVPDISAPSTLEDLLAGRDAAMEAILTQTR